MSQVSAPRSRAANPPAHPGTAPWRTAALWTAGIAVALVGMFLAHLVLRDHRLPLGPDGPVYVWWARVADAGGLDAVRRPGLPGLSLVLGTVLLAEPVVVTAALEIVLAVATALAGAAFVEAALGEDRLRAAIAAVLVGTFASFLAPGWLANLALVALVLAALAAFSLAERSWRPAALGAACLVAGGLTHPMFLALSLAVLAGALLFLGPATLRRIRTGEPPWSMGTVRVAGAAGAAAGITALGIAAFAGGDRVPGDSSQDQFFRRLGLRGFLEERLRERQRHDTRRVRLATTAGVVLGAMLPLVPRPRGAGWRFLIAVVASWTVITVVGLVLLWQTDLAPAARLLTFAFFLPLLGAAVAAAAIRTRDWRAAIAVVAAGAMVWGGMTAWYRQSPFMSEEELAAVSGAAAALEPVPPGTPLVFLVDTTEFAATFHVTRAANVIRAGLPGDRAHNSWIVVGSPDDLEAGRMGSGNRDPEYRAISRVYLEEARPVLDRAVVLVLRPFNESGFEDARETGRQVSGDAVVLRAPERIRVGASPATPADRPGASPWAIGGIAAAGLVVLALLGGGWARWGLAGASRAAVLSAAPAVGAAVAIGGALAADRLALPAASAGTAAAALFAALGYALTLRARHQAIDAPEHG